MSAVLFGALLHASWNAIVKSGADKTLDTIFVACAAALVSAAALPFLPMPAPQSWPWLAVSAIVQLAYYALVAAAYRTGDMSHVYPVMRGTAPMLTALVAAVLLAERLAPSAWFGICVVCLGVVLLAVDGRWRGRPGAAMSYALANAVVICAYTLLDGIGARLSGSPPAYVSWLFVLDGAALAGYAAVHHRGMAKRYLAQRWRVALAGGACTWTSYAIALWAMTQAPVALVAALRETSVLFGVGIAALVLGERISRARYGAALLVCAGAVLFKMS